MIFSFVFIFLKNTEKVVYFGTSVNIIFLKGLINMQEYLNAIALLPQRYKSVVAGISENILKDIKEIRFRNGEPLVLNTSTQNNYQTESGHHTAIYSNNLVCTEHKDMQEFVFSLSRRSLHTYQDMIAKGFIPLPNGCKAGVAGRAVMKNGAVYSVSDFNSVNIRISREYHNCSKEVYEGVGECRSYLIVGSPMSGKTTVLRDLCRFYSGENAVSPLKIAVIDERDEIASRSFGCFRDVGVHTDVLTLYPKAIGTEIAVRTLSPDIVVLDEIGTEDEVNALLSGVNSGVDFIATAHGGSFSEVLRRPNIKTLVNSGVFKKAVVLEGKQSPCKVKEIISL